MEYGRMIKIIKKPIKFILVFILIFFWVFLPLADLLTFEIGGRKITLAPEIKEVQAAVAVDAVSTGTGSGSSITVSHTTGSGANRLMLVGISAKSPAGIVISSIAYGGVALTLVGGTSNWLEIRIYRLVAPVTGTANLVVNFSTAPSYGCTVGVMTFTGVDQTTPLGTFNEDNSYGTTASVNVSSATGELVFDTLVGDNLPTVGAGQTEQWKASGYGGHYGSGSTELGATTVTMSWTFAIQNWRIGAVPIKPLSNESPAAPTLHDIPFANEKTGDSTPDFEFTASDPDGTADIIYQIQIDDDYAFGSPLVNCESDTSCAAGAGSFTNTVSGGDTSPFNEGERIRFTPTTAMTTGVTYYWRVRAEDDSVSGGSGSYGSYSAIQSVTFITDTSPSEWFQTTDEQFDTDTLTDTETTGTDGVKLQGW